MATPRPALTFSPETLRHFGRELLCTYGVKAPDAELLVDTLVTAELWGHTSHGMLRLPWYCSRLASGAMKPECSPQVLRDTGPLVLLDGQDGLGQNLAERAVSISTARAKEDGIGAVGVRRSNHFGTVAYLTRHAAEQGYACLMTTNSSPAMAPWGGRDKRLGSNPWSIAVPAGRHGVVVMDLSNTEVARGKIYAAHAEGEAIPQSWAAAPDGVPTTDPASALDGLLLPMAGPKGYVITMMMDLLAGALTGAGMGTEITGPYSPEGSSNCGHLVLSIKVDDTVGLAEFEDRVATYIDEIRSASKASGVDRIYTPGELEDEHAARTHASGIPLPTRTVEQLNQLAASRNVERL